MLSFPRATEMFHFARFASAPYNSPCGEPSSADDPAFAGSGCPIRTSRDLSLLGGSPGLIAAFHVLHRLLAPRHPPYALGSLTLDNPLLRLSWWLPPLTPLLFTCQRAQLKVKRLAALELTFRTARTRYGAASVPRRQGFQLALFLVEMTGIEPATSGLQSRRSPC